MNLKVKINPPVKLPASVVLRLSADAAGPLRVIDAAGRDVGTLEVALVDPPAPPPVTGGPVEPTPEQLEARAGVCETCEHGSDLVRVKGKFPVWGVKCAKCPTCTNRMSLKTGRCVLDLWPDQKPQTGGRQGGLSHERVLA